MNSAGKILAETVTETTWDGLTAVHRVAIVDVGAEDVTSALDRATKHFQARGWVIVTRTPDLAVVMGSPKWGNARLWLYSLEFIQQIEDLGADVKKAIKKAQTTVEPNVPVYLEADPSGE
ncbi:hypothetical protein ACQP2K_31410 [Microbispora siamensis]